MWKLNEKKLILKVFLIYILYISSITTATLNKREIISNDENENIITTTANSTVQNNYIENIYNSSKNVAFTTITSTTSIPSTSTSTWNSTLVNIDENSNVTAENQHQSPENDTQPHESQIDVFDEKNHFNTTTIITLSEDDTSDGVTETASGESLENFTENIRNMTNTSNSHNQHNGAEMAVATTISLEKMFEELELTTPLTLYFDEKQTEINEATDDIEKLINADDDSSIQSSTTTLPAEILKTTTKNNLNLIKENSEIVKNSSLFVNITDSNHQNYNLNTNEVNQTVHKLNSTTITPTIHKTTFRQEKKGKFLDPESGTQYSDNFDSFTENTVAPTDEMWALAAMKDVEQMMIKKEKQSNYTVRPTMENDTFITKSVADWASIMENMEFSSDSTQIGEISTTIDPTEDFSTVYTEGVENRVVIKTVQPPSPIDDVNLEDDLPSTTTISSIGKSTTVDTFSTTNRDEITSIASIEDSFETTTLPEDISTINYSSSEDETTYKEIIIKLTTDNNFILSESANRRTTTSSPTTTGPSLSTITENIRIEVLNGDETSQSSSKIENDDEYTVNTEPPIKVDTSLDNNSIERSTTEKSVTHPDSENSHSIDTTRDELKYNTINQNETIHEFENTVEPTKKPYPTEAIDEENEVDENDKITSSPSELEGNEPIENEGADVNAIIAITVSVIGVIALILLVGFLYIMRKRQQNLPYGQRCRPVGLDAYSLDNVSVYNSVRRKANLRLSKRSYGNSAFEDPALKNNSLHIAALSQFVQDQNSIFEEFKDIPQVTARVDEVPQGCEAKNRYANVVPLPETRVHLKRINEDEKTEYINANFIRGPKDSSHYYIACQAPLENTIADFWRMIWEQNSKVIIMATDLTEGGVDKCAEYLPPSIVLDNTRLYDDYQVILKNREVKEKYAVSTVHLKNMQTKTWREITHLWYQWPETGIPTDEASIIAMLLEARSYLKISASEQIDRTDNNKTTDETEVKNENNDSNINKKSLQRTQGPLTVHCSPGTGRTGTIVACDITIRALELPTRTVDIPQIVYYVRRGRASSVRTREQYEFVYKVANMYATKLAGPTTEN